MKLLDVHPRSLQISSQLSRYYMPRAIEPLEVIGVLNRERISFVLVGAHGLGGWMNKPRATEDVDIVVATRHLKKACKALLAAFPQLDAELSAVVIRLRERQTGQVQIDIMKPNQTLYRETFKHTHVVQQGKLTYRIPSLEMAIAMKFAPMISPFRGDTEKLQDAHDFRRIIEVNAEIDLDLLAKLGELVYPGGGAEIVEKVRQVRAGEKMTL